MYKVLQKKVVNPTNYLLQEPAGGVRAFTVYLRNLTNLLTNLQDNSQLRHYDFLS